jgi:hypothetical protein
MQKVRVPINSFQYGEVSGSLLMRVDSPVYASSAQSLENMIVMSEGSVKKRYGLKHIYDYGITFDSAHPGQSHLFKFVFSDDEQYLVSVEHEQVRCFLLNANGTVTLEETITEDTNTDPLPFDQDYLQEYTYAQYGDVMFICHPLFMPRMVIRTSLTSFEITPFSFDQRYDGLKTYQPYSRFQATGVTLDPSGTTGSVTLTTSAPHWTADHVGAVVRYHESEIEITAYTSSTVVTGTVIDTLAIRLSVLNPLRTTDSSTRVEVTQIAHGFSGGEAVVISNASAVGGINAGNLNGSRTVGGVIDENTWYFTAGGSASSAEDGGGYVTITTHAPIADWDEQAFSAVRGYPAAVVFHENRLCYAGTLAQPDSLWMSALGDFFNFDVRDAGDTDAIALVAATGTVNEIRYLISNRDLQIFGAWGELYVPSYLNQPITPTNVQIRLQTPYGCDHVQPVSIDGATIFVQRGGTVVREYLYTDREDAYTSTSVSTLASHLVVTPKCMTVAHGAFGQAESYAFMSNGNGDIALFNSNRAEKRASWTRLTTDGNFCSVLGVGTRVFANVYDADGDMHLCEFAGEIGLDFYVTGAVSSNYITVGSSYSVGDVVSVVNNDGLQYIGQRTVVLDGGVNKISMTGYTGTYHVGVAFPVSITTNPIDAALQGGPRTGDVRGVSAAIVDLRSTRSVKVNNRAASIDSTFSGKKEFRLLGYGRDPQVTVSQNEPLPLQLNGLIAELMI